MHKSRKELKALARTQMQGKFPTLIGAFVLQNVIIMLLSTFAVSLFPETDLLSNIFYYITIFLVNLFLGTIEAGMSLISLEVACGMQCRAHDIYRACKENPAKAIRLQVIFVVINTICTLPADLFALASPSVSDLGTMAQILLWQLLGSSVAILISLSFAPAFYMFWDFPEYDVKYILSHSREIMKGNKGRFLALQLSFLPLALLTVLSFGIASLWTTPYMNVTYANFYLNIMANKNHQS